MIFWSQIRRGGAALVLFALLGLSPASAADTQEAEAVSAAATALVPPPRDTHTGYTKPAVLRGPIRESEYVVGPGDRFSITLWGAKVVSFSESVTPEGDLVLPGIATIRVADLRLDRAKEEIEARLALIYRGVDIGISLVELRQVRVDVLGDVARPGPYVCRALDLASELIDQAGGFGENASRRNIRITRRSGDTATADLVRYQNTGDLAANPPILDGDAVFVPFATGFVHVDGTVSRPGRYELVPGETVGSLIDVAGGFGRAARSDTVEIREFVDSVTTRSILVDIRTGEGDSHALDDGDQVYVRAIPEWRLIERVAIEGEVVYPGAYGINEGDDRLSGVLRRAGGPTEKASLFDAKLVRTAGMDEVDLEFERLKKIPVEEMTETEYAYFKTQSRERRGIVVVDFEKVAGGDSSEDVLLKNGDIIQIPKKREAVAVSGQVADPGMVTHVPGQKYDYYIDRAGGYAADARKGKTRVIKGATGEWVPAGDAGVLVPGDVVWVPEKPERDWWATIQDVARFAASIATVYLVIDQAANN